jgi:SAM-dependent methyltransferase
MRSWLRQRFQHAERKLIVFDRVTDWSVLRRIRPYRPELGSRRGKFVDRFYIEKFLLAHRECIHGTVAEFESAQYTGLYGGERVEHFDVLDKNEENDNRTLTLDLAEISSVPEAVYDCVICTQTLFLIRDYPVAIRSLHKMLKPGGVLLATVPGICPVVRGHLLAGVGEDWWRFTARSARYIFGEVFGDADTTVESYGNVLTATAFLHGLVQEELTLEELEYSDPDYELIVGIKATRRVAK